MRINTLATALQTKIVSIDRPILITRPPKKTGCASSLNVINEKNIEELDKKIGVNRIKAIHLNDSKRGLGSRVDRHEHIGLGMIEEKGFKSILSNNIINRLPLILETPINSRRDDIGNINRVKALASSVGIL